MPVVDLAALPAAGVIVDFEHEGGPFLLDFLHFVSNCAAFVRCAGHDGLAFVISQVILASQRGFEGQRLFDVFTAYRARIAPAVPGGDVDCCSQLRCSFPTVMEFL